MMKQMTALVLLCLLVAHGLAYTPSVALQLAYYSDVAYASADNINAWNCKRCGQYVLQNPKVFGNTIGDIQGFTGYSPNLNAIILAFRGSSNFQNWIINLSFNQVAYPRCGNCMVHNGFMTGYTIVKGDILSQIQTLKALYRDSKIYITGHSLGGAFAVLALPDVKDFFGPVDGLVTFGQPRVGNKEFANWFGSQVTHERVIHYADLVPHVPPQGQYFHDGTEIWYDRNMQTYKTCQGDTNDCSNSLPKTSLNTGDHSMDIYITLKVGSSWLQAFDSFITFMGNSEKSQNLWSHQE